MVRAGTLARNSWEGYEYAPVPIRRVGSGYREIGSGRYGRRPAPCR